VEDECDMVESNDTLSDNERRSGALGLRPCLSTNFGAPAAWHDVSAWPRRRLRQPGGFHLPILPGERIWETPTGRANFPSSKALQKTRRSAIRPLKVLPYAIPQGSIGAYYPETNPLLPLAHHDLKSKTPAAKSIPVLVRPQ
jgi:hypothetical protein